MKIRLTTLALALALTGCSTMGAPIPVAERGAAHQLTGEEVLHANYQNLYDAVQALRPLWLRTRSSGTLRNPAEVQVYVDNVHVGGVDALRRMQTTGIKEIRYLDAASAATRYPRVVHAGVIVVMTGQSADRS